jgi:signal transduction histidine kinase
MSRLRLKTQLLISTLVIICALTGAMLLIVRHTVRAEIDSQVRDSVAASVRAFESVQNQRQDQLSRTTAMLAELPTLKALMTTNHALTIRDGSLPFWQLAGSDLFVVANTKGEIMALHAKKSGLNSADVEQDLTRSLDSNEDAAWWYADDQLYWVFIRPITAGSGADLKNLGALAIGYQVDSTVAEQLALVAGGKIVLLSGAKIIASTLSSREQDELQDHLGQYAALLGSGTQEVNLAAESYQAAAVSLHADPRTPVQCYVLVPLRRPMEFTGKLDRTILALGISALVCVTLLLSFVAGTITRPMDNLLAGVRALARGDYAFSITPRGSSEVVELGRAFSKMRGELLDSQQRQIETEQVAALGRAASSISHDLRHSLAAVVANAEFLYEADKLKLDRDEIYEEIKVASEQMTELLDSLRELSREQRTLSLVTVSLEAVVRRAVDAVLARPEFHHRLISIQTPRDTTGVFDPKKIERSLFNLLLNACEATSDRGKIDIEIKIADNSFEVRIADDGVGIPAAIRDTLFDPFISSGKSNGTGLGLAIVSKIIHDHYGSVCVEQTGESGTVFLIKFPRSQTGIGDSLAVWAVNDRGGGTGRG